MTEASTLSVDELEAIEREAIERELEQKRDADFDAGANTLELFKRRDFYRSVEF